MSRGLLGVLLVVVTLGVAAALTVSKLTSSSLTVPPGLFTTTTAHGSPPGATTTAGPSSIERAALTSACNADAQSVQSAVRLYMAATGAAPPNLSALAATSSAGATSAGPWLRAVPSTAHYTIYVDAHGTVGIFPAHASPTGLVPAADDYAAHPDLCASVPS